MQSDLRDVAHALSVRHRHALPLPSHPTCASPRSTSGRTRSTSSSPTCTPTAASTPLAREKEMLRLGDVVEPRRAHHRPTPPTSAVATVRRFKHARRRRRAPTEIARVRDQRDPPRRERRRARRPDRGRDRRRGRGDQRPHRGASSSSARSAPACVLEPAPALCFDLGGGSVEIMVGDASGLRWATSENLGVGRLTAEFVAVRPALEGRPPPPPRPPRRGARARSPPTVRDVRAQARRRQQRHARGPRAHGRRPPQGRRPRLAQPAHVHARRVPAAARADHLRRRRRSGAGSRASRPGASTSSPPARCSSRPRWSCSTSTS